MAPSDPIRDRLAQLAPRTPEEEEGALKEILQELVLFALSNAGFFDVDHHSGEPYETTDWTIAIDGPAGTIEWSTDTFAVDENANALRWGTMFSFWFDSDTAPTNAVHTLEFFKPGDP